MGKGAGSQREALGTILNRLESVMRSVTDQPQAEEDAKQEIRAEPDTEPGTLGDLYHKLKMVRDNLDSSNTPKDQVASPSLASALDRDTQLQEEDDAADVNPTVEQQSGRGSEQEEVTTTAEEQDHSLDEL